MFLEELIISSVRDIKVYFHESLFSSENNISQM
jgi:hypothetical protein